MRKCKKREGIEWYCQLQQWKTRGNTLGVVHALNDLAQIELGIEIDGCNTILQSGVAGDERMRQ
jgi:hypothetical protein